MADAGMMRMDEPAWVAHKVIDAIKRDKKDVYLGLAETLFARLNSPLPNLVDRALVKQAPTLLGHAFTNKQI